MKIYKKEQKSQRIILILCFIILFFICGIAIIQQSITYNVKYQVITRSRTYNSNIINNIQINEMNCAYDSKTNTWFFPQSLDNEGSKVLLKTGIISDIYNVSFVTDKELHRNRR